LSEGFLKISSILFISYGLFSLSSFLSLNKPPNKPFLSLLSVSGLFLSGDKLSNKPF